MLVVLFLLALAWLTADFAALVYLYFQFGLGPVVALMVSTAVVGIGLFRWQMRGIWREFREKVAQTEVPGTTAAEGFLLFLATCLLIAPFPGLDGVGLLLMCGPIRRFLARRVRGWVVKRFEPGPGSFVFQMGGIASQGWPPPGYPEPTPGLDPNDPRALPDDPAEPTADPVENRDAIEEAEFRPVPPAE